MLQPGQSKAFNAQPKLYLLSVKKGEAQMQLLSSFSKNKSKISDQSHDLSSSQKVISKQNTQLLSNETYFKMTQTNTQITTSRKNIHNLDISFGKEPQSDIYQTVQSCDMRQARLRQQQQKNLKDTFQRAMASLDRKLSTHDYLQTKEKIISIKVQNDDKNQKENKENTVFAIMEGQESIKKNQKKQQQYYQESDRSSSKRSQNHSQNIMTIQQQPFCLNTENNPGFQELNIKQNFNKATSKPELKIDQKTKENVNSNKSNLLLRQPLQTRMQQLEGELVKKEQGMKQIKRVSWELQGDNTSNDQGSQKQFMLIQNNHNGTEIQYNIHSDYELNRFSAVPSKQVNNNKKHINHPFYEILQISQRIPNFLNFSHLIDQNNINHDSQSKPCSSNKSRNIPFSVDSFETISQQDSKLSNSISAAVAVQNKQLTSCKQMNNSRSIADEISLQKHHTAHTSANNQNNNILSFSRNQNITKTNPSKYISSLNSSMHYHPTQIKEGFVKQQKPHNDKGTLITSIDQVTSNKGYAISEIHSVKQLEKSKNNNGQQFKQLRRSIQTSSIF